jgi:hypothetical protein
VTRYLDQRLIEFDSGGLRLDASQMPGDEHPVTPTSPDPEQAQKQPALKQDGPANDPAIAPEFPWETAFTVLRVACFGAFLAFGIYKARDVMPDATTFQCVAIAPLVIPAMILNWILPEDWIMSIVGWFLEHPRIGTVTGIVLVLGSWGTWLRGLFGMS